VIPHAPVENSPLTLWRSTAPLFEKERHLRGLALIANAAHPRHRDRPVVNATFSPDDYPVDTGEVDFSQVFEQRFDGEKPYGGVCSSQNVDSRKSVLAVLNADAPPHIFEQANPTKFATK
jgi:hypothetical protein